MNCHEMPKIAKCEVSECFYNSDKQCHVPAINVGGEKHPKCDTFVSRSNHIGCSGESSVGACHTSVCEYNSDLTCSAKEITVGCHGSHADCDTFELK